jgi:hypothetical protein
MFKKILPLFLSVIFSSDCRKNNDCQESKEFPKIDGWLIESIPPPKNVYDIVDCYFETDGDGTLTSKGKDIYETHNNGYTWGKLIYDKIPNHELGAYTSKNGVVTYVTFDSTSAGNNTFPKIMKLQNDGTWGVTNSNVRGKFISIFFPFPAQACAIIQKPNASFGLYYSLDKGITWSPSTDIKFGTDTTPKWQIGVLNGAIYVMDAQSKIWKTTDIGVTWQPLVEFTNTKIYQFQIINNEEDIVYTDDVGLALYKQGKPLERLSENSTNLLFFATNGAGITMQVPLDCANFDKSRNFGFERRCLFGSRANATNWVQSENYWYLNNWKTQFIGETSAYFFYDRYIYYIKYLN